MRMPSLAVLALLAPLAACGGGSTPPGPTPPAAVTIALQAVASGLTAPVVLTHAGDGSGRLFVVEQVGRIRLIAANGALVATPFLDLTALLAPISTTYDERGLLGLAFHPQFAINGRFFVRYSAPRAGVSGEPCFGTSRGCHSEVLSEFLVQGDPTTNPVADATSERVLLTVDQPQFNHDGGDIAFGPDGFLYVGLGDGGGAHDGLADTPPSHGPIGHGQDTTTLLGAMLRLDVDATPGLGLQYAVPANNPFVGLAGRDEIFAFGFRNPYRFSFDDGPGGNGALIVGDVGQDLFEEVDVVVRGGNYGWAHREGFACFDPLAPSNPPGACTTTGAGGETLRDPVLAYGHNVGIAVIGGHVYRGSDVPALDGQYVFGDFSQDFGATGRLFHAPMTGTFAWTRLDLGIDGAPGGLGRALLGLGEDEQGELYVLAADVIAPVGTSGVVLRIDTP